MWATHQLQILVKEKVISSLKYVDFQDAFKKITILNGKKCEQSSSIVLTCTFFKRG